MKARGMISMRKQTCSICAEKYFLCLVVFLLSLSNNALAIDYYKRHYIVLVDNTTTSMNEDVEGLKEIGKMFENLFLNKEYYTGIDSQKINSTETYLADLLFDPLTDEISLFKFGTTSDRYDINDLNYGLNRIRHKVRNNGNELLSLTCEMIKPVNQFQKSDKDIDAFLKESLLPLFEGEGVGGVNMSSIMYPIVLSMVDTTLASAEYYIIIVSNFKVRGVQENADDYGLIRTAMDQNSNHAKNFSEQLWKLKSPFYTSELMKIQSLKDSDDMNNSMTHIKSIKAICYKLGVKSLQGVSAHVTSNIDLKQLSFEGCGFALSPVSIAFTHDSSLEVNKIELSILDYDGNVVYASPVIDAVFDSVEMKYNMPKVEIIFERIPEIGDKLMFNYVFYTSPKDKDGNCLLPFVFPVEHDFEFSLANFIKPKDPIIFTIIMMIAVFMIIAALLVLLYILIKRGKDSKKLIVELEHSNADEGTFQDVRREKGSLLLKCDYPKVGVTSITYTLQGHFEEQRRKAIPWFVNYVYVKASLSKDSPNGMTIHPIDAKEGGWLPVIVKNNQVTINLQVDYNNCTEEVKYVKVWLQWSYEPRFLWHQNRPFKKCSMKAVRTESEFVKAFKEHEETFNSLLDREVVKFSCSDGAFVIENFIRKPFTHPDHWVGIDPGTSGSCVTLGYGVIGNAGNPNIIRVTAKDTAGCEKSITNSLIVLGGNVTPTNNISEWKPDTDYKYGIKAYEKLEQYINEGAYCFQSIKKLLGYKKGGNDGRIKVKIGNNEYEFTGFDLQDLLVRALIKDVTTNFVSRLKTEPQLVQLRDNLFPNIEANIEAFERAVVTIPNNYQLPQILDMVGSVKNNGFKEVKYIYEPEGILFHYLKETYNSHRTNETENVIVYDMGGATINATVFKVDIKMVSGQPQYYVSTLSRLGYAVGGDDVDYAIIEYLMHFDHIAKLFDNDTDRYQKQDENKTNLINIAQKFKIALVQKVTQNLDEYDGSLDTADQFVAIYLNDIIRLFDSTKTFMFDDLEDSEKASLRPMEPKMDFSNSLRRDLLSSTWMTEYVFEKVKDAVLDMINTPDVQMAKKIDKIIFSGRTALFPGIKDTVNRCLKENNLMPKEEYPLNGDLKSPVADGACWYGIYEGKIVFLDNSRVTSSYGLCFTRPGENPYVEMIPQNSKYEENNTQIERSKLVKSKFQSDAGHVNFYQVMGAHNDKDDDSLFNENNRHKVRFLTSINLGGSEAKEETITVYANGIVKCDVDYPAKPPEQKAKTTEFDARDITKENARPYLFSVSDKEKHQITMAIGWNRQRRTSNH